MKANLFINYYVDSNPKRHRELVCCLLENVKNDDIDAMIVFISKDHVDNLTTVVSKNDVTKAQKDKIVWMITEERPSYNAYFKLTRTHPKDINIIANTDIVIGEATVKRLKNWEWRNYCLALSRWDYINDSMNKNYTRHYAHRDSQDVWIVKGGFPDIKQADFTLGVAGCDNKIALYLSKFYHVINPSIDIKTYHYHITGIRNYKDEAGEVLFRLPPPYKLLFPIKLPR